MFPINNRLQNSSPSLLPPHLLRITARAANLLPQSALPLPQDYRQGFLGAFALEVPGERQPGTAAAAAGRAQTRFVKQEKELAAWHSE